MLVSIFMPTKVNIGAEDGILEEWSIKSLTISEEKITVKLQRKDKEGYNQLTSEYSTGDATNIVYFNGEYRVGSIAEIACEFIKTIIEIKQLLG